jgi:hypothetical protein
MWCASAAARWRAALFLASSARLRCSAKRSARSAPPSASLSSSRRSSDCRWVRRIASSGQHRPQAVGPCGCGPCGSRWVDGHLGALLSKRLPPCDAPQSSRREPTVSSRDAAASASKMQPAASVEPVAHGSRGRRPQRPSRSTCGPARTPRRSEVAAPHRRGRARGAPCGARAQRRVRPSHPTWRYALRWSSAARASPRRA